MKSPVKCQQTNSSLLNEFSYVRIRCFNNFQQDYFFSRLTKGFLASHDFETSRNEQNTLKMR